MTNLQEAFADALNVNVSSRGLIDDLARAAFGVWQYNGHAVADALLHVHRRHASPAVQKLAGEAYDMALVMPIMRAAFESDFAARVQIERASQSAWAL